MARLEVSIPSVKEENHRRLRFALLEVLPGNHSATSYCDRLDLHLELEPADNPTILAKQAARHVASKIEEICPESNKADVYYLCTDSSNARRAHIEDGSIQYIRRL